MYKKFAKYMKEMSDRKAFVVYTATFALMVLYIHIRTVTG